MNETIKLILSLSLSASILAVLLFAIKPLIRNKISKSIQYYIWIVVLIRLVLPFSFEASIMNELFYGNQTPSATASPTIIQPLGGTENKISDTSISPIIKESTASGVYNSNTDHSGYFKDLFNQYALYLWLLGAIIALAVNLVGYVRFSKYIRNSNKPATDGENRMLAALLNGRNNVRLVRNHFVSTPMLIGIIRPYIIIPDINFDEKQLKNILLHEITHLNHFDIAVKWLTMIASSIHWFNPLMYFIKKEVNNACELACDEAVVKNLSPAEKQAYGDTLISIVAEHKYPIGVLQATMCEEKKSLKERLLSIMNHNKKSKPVVIFSIILIGFVIFGALYLGAGIGIGKDIPPNIYISAEGSKTKSALIGTYEWSYRNKHVSADSDHPTNFKYEMENVVSVTGGQQLIIDTQKIKIDKKYNFTIEQISVYKDGRLTEFESIEPSFLNGSLYIQAPPDAGEYIYELVLNYKDKGTVSYGFTVRVDMLTYALAEISKHKTSYVGDNSKVSAIAGNLPVPDHYFIQHYTSIKTSEKPYGLTIYYEAASDIEYGDEWPIVSPDSAIEGNSRMNALVVFCMIDNLDEVTFAFRNSQSDGKLDESKYDTSFKFQRASFEEKYGELSALAADLDKLQSILANDVHEPDKDTTIKTPLPEFTDAEVAAARAVVEEYFRSIAAKDDEAILKTLTPIHDNPNGVLYGDEIRMLLSIDYNEDDPMRKGYVNSGRGSINGTNIENAIVFKVNFNVKYPEGGQGSFNVGDYTNWRMILIRDDNSSPWLINDQGY